MSKAKDARQTMRAADELTVTIDRLLLEESKRRVQRSLDGMAACPAGSADVWTVDEWDTSDWEDLVGDWAADFCGNCDCFPECFVPKTANSDWFVADNTGVWPSDWNLGAAAYQVSMGIRGPVGHGGGIRFV